jgi:hypothetical protein
MGRGGWGGGYGGYGGWGGGYGGWGMGGMGYGAPMGGYYGGYGMTGGTYPTYAYTNPVGFNGAAGGYTWVNGPVGAGVTNYARGYSGYTGYTNYNGYPTYGGYQGYAGYPAYGTYAWPNGANVINGGMMGARPR